MTELGLEFSPREQVILDVQSAIKKPDWSALRSLDGALAEIAPGDLFYGFAIQARISWRLETGTAVRAREALALADALLTRQRVGEIYLLRARAGAIAGDKKLAWAAHELGLPPLA